MPPSLPAEILQSIFEEAGMAGREVDYSKSYSLVNSESLRISHVCRLWRTVALNTGRLWVDIRFPLDDPVAKLQEIWTVITTRAKNCPLSVDIIEMSEDAGRALKRGNFFISDWRPDPVRIDELRLSAFKTDRGSLDRALSFASGFSSLTIQYKAGAPTRNLAGFGSIRVEELAFRLSHHASCVRLSLVGVVLDAFGIRRLLGGTLNVRHLSVRYCTVLHGDVLSILIHSCPRLESFIFKNNVHPGSYHPTPTTFPRTIRLIETDDSLNWNFLLSGKQMAVYPRLTTFEIDYIYLHEEFLQVNPTIVTLTIPWGADITDIAHVAPQIRALKVHNPKNAVSLCKADSYLFPHLRELHIYLSEPVSIDQLHQIMLPVGSFARPHDRGSDLGRLILTWTKTACIGEAGIRVGARSEYNLKPWYQWLEERGYWGRVVVTRSEEE
jgi:hypothetical protein